MRGLGHDAELLGREATQAEVAAPLYQGAVLQRSGTATLNPVKLVLGLRDVALRLGVRLFEHTPATDIRDLGLKLRIYTPQGRVEAKKALLATNAFPALVRKLRRYVVPVYDYALTIERLPPERLDSIGWENRQAVEDAGNVFLAQCWSSRRPDSWDRCRTAPGDLELLDRHRPVLRYPCLKPGPGHE